MIGPLNKGQAGDDFRRGRRAELRPPRARGDAAVEREQTEMIATKPRATASITPPGAMMRHAGDGEAEMETRAVAHRRVAPRHVDMHGIIRLYISERRDDNAPDALDRVERQQTAMALGDGAHHRSFAGRTKGRAAALARLDGDQPVNDPPALHQQFMHRRVDTVDIDAKIGKRFKGDWL